jgi:hypothetical protein
VLGCAALAVAVVMALVAAGCGSSEKSAAEKPPLVPPAKTQAEWIDRLVNRFLRDMNENLNIVNALRTTQVMVYLRTGNETTVGILQRRMADLRKCSRKLDRVGPPPASDEPLDRIYADFRKSCPPYERVAKSVLAAIPLLGSRDAADVAKGEKEFGKASAPSGEGARHFAAGVDLLQRNGLLRPYQG